MVSGSTAVKKKPSNHSEKPWLFLTPEASEGSSMRRPHRDRLPAGSSVKSPDPDRDSEPRAAPGSSRRSRRRARPGGPVLTALPSCARQPPPPPPPPPRPRTAGRRPAREGRAASAATRRAHHRAHTRHFRRTRGNEAVGPCARPRPRPPHGPPLRPVLPQLCLLPACAQCLA